MRHTILNCCLTVLLLPAISFALPNPASVNCVNHGNKLVLLKNTGICIFKDKSYCEEWAYFRGICHPHQQYLPSKFSKKTLKQFCIVKKNKHVKVITCQKVNAK